MEQVRFVICAKPKTFRPLSSKSRMTELVDHLTTNVLKNFKDFKHKFSTEFNKNRNRHFLPNKKVNCDCKLLKHKLKTNRQ
ncbi:unnamed protein product [Moneuplotes crassus]|uniref:Uncharacterized protein n=1 Tax=Euplotes crassus TaxID=5936 RepID=A0AAD2D3W2_EUPCR|nr:unnamed protein product [Moneuplotes crassus]